MQYYKSICNTIDFLLDIIPLIQNFVSKLKESEETKMAFNFSKKKFFRKIILGISAFLKFIIAGIAESISFA